MEYFYYVLVIALMLALCLVAVRRAKTEEPKPRGAARTRKGAATSEQALDALPPGRQRVALDRQLRQVPTPWGWPGSEIHANDSHAGGNGLNGHGHNLQHWVDWLISEKRTIDDDEYRLRRNACLRAMIEDRYGRAVEPRTQPYEKVKPPRLRDPSLPYDQQDNFPSGQTERIVKGLKPQPGQPLPQALRRSRQAALKDVKTPWGW